MRGNFTPESNFLIPWAIPPMSNGRARIMTQQSSTNWNSPKTSLNDRIADVDDYVFIGKKRDGSTFVMSNGDQRSAENLLHNSPLGQTEGANLG